MLGASSMHGRRYHRKSRTGCMQCKKRKVKCDEGKPKCHKCEVYGVLCTYATEDNTKTTSISQRTSPEASADGLAQNASEGVSESGSRFIMSGSLPLFALELLHHWTTETSQTLSAEPQVQTMWRQQAPKVGFTTPFVMHAILAVSALHLYRLCPTHRKQECLDQAHTHHMAAMQDVAPNITNLMEEQGTTVILFSWLTCVYACGRPPTQNDALILGESGTPEWLTFLRGNKVVLESSRDMFRHGVLAPVFNNGARHSYVRRNTPAIDGEQHVWRVRDFIMGHVSDIADREMYIEAVGLLSQSYAFVMAGVSRAADTTVVMPWLFEVPDRFMDCLQRKSPPALIVFAYFCVLVKRLDWMWWLEGLSERFMDEMFNALDPEYREWLRWPSEAIGWTGFDVPIRDL